MEAKPTIKQLNILTKNTTRGVGWVTKFNTMRMTKGLMTAPKAPLKINRIILIAICFFVYKDTKSTINKCAFFVASIPSFATGIGDVLEPMHTECTHLHGLHLLIVKPSIAISTAQAFAFVKPQPAVIKCRDIVAQPVGSEWRKNLTNDFEVSAFKLYPELHAIKEKLYSMGARYAQMSGSGSAFFGIFESSPTLTPETFGGMFTYLCKL